MTEKINYNVEEEKKNEKLLENRRKFKPKNDVIFQELFKPGNEDITKAFLSSIIKEDITEINMDVSTHTNRDYLNSKLGILDLRVKLENNVQCNVEVQLIDYGNMIDRMLFYWSKQFSKNLNKSQDYSKLERTISIAILNFKIEDLKDIKNFYSNWKIIETKDRKKILTNKLDIYIIEMPKLLEQKHKELKDNLTQWMLFLNNPDSVEVKEIMEENDKIKEAAEKYDVILGDEELIRLAELKEKGEMDERNMKRVAREEGMAEGMKQGMEKGKQEGHKSGLIEGAQKNKLEVAKLMKKDKVDISIISKYTGLTEEEIEKLK